MKKSHIIYLLMATVLLATVSYQFLDRELAFALSPIRKHHFWFSLFHWMQYSVDIIRDYLTPVLFIYLVIAFIIDKCNTRFNRFLFSFSVSIFAAEFITNRLRIVFGRYWPETFLNNNLSLIRDGVYGFTFFNMHRECQSLPSGHSAAIFAMMTILWIYYPKLRILSVTMCVIVVTGLLGCNYHFLSDIIAGACVGLTSATLINYYVSSTANVLKSPGSTQCCGQ